MSRRSSSRDEAADVDLVPLDPVTGAILGPDIGTDGADQPAPADDWVHATKVASRGAGVRSMLFEIGVPW